MMSLLGSHCLNENEVHRIGDRSGTYRLGTAEGSKIMIEVPNRLGGFVGYSHNSKFGTNRGLDRG